MDRLTKRKMLKCFFYILVALWGLKAGYHIGRVCEFEDWQRWLVGGGVAICGALLFRAITTPADDRGRSNVETRDSGG